ncbi:MAG: DUF5615 family PIN-like protein [Cyanobacteriota bacterium]
MSRTDSTVLDYARQQGRVLLTRNCADFQELHQANPVHPGILAVFPTSTISKLTQEVFYESPIDIRPRQNNRSMEILDPA